MAKKIKAEKTPEVEIYFNSEGMWSWRVKAGAGRSMIVSDRGYLTEKECVDSLKRVHATLANFLDKHQDLA